MNYIIAQIFWQKETEWILVYNLLVNVWALIYAKEQFLHILNFNRKTPSL